MGVHGLSPLIDKLERLAKLNDADRSLLATLPMTERAYGPSHYLVRDGKPVNECCVLISGFACRHKLAANGGRQIVSFHLPGDMLDRQHVLLDRADHNVETITDARVAWIPKVDLRRVAAESAKSQGKLGNATFVGNAPAAVVEQERQRLADWTAQEAALQSHRSKLS